MPMARMASAVTKSNVVLTCKPYSSALPRCFMRVTFFQTEPGTCDGGRSGRPSGRLAPTICGCAARGWAGEVGAPRVSFGASCGVVRR